MRGIPLTKGLATLVDDEFYDILIAMGSWACSAGGYAERSSQSRRPLKMHRVVWTLSGRHIAHGLHLDHINRDRLDNRLDNLRLVTPSQNAANTSLRSDNTSRYKGVSLQRSNGRWRVYVRSKYIATFSDRIEAAKAYDEAAEKEFGEFAALNFPKDIPTVHLAPSDDLLSRVDSRKRSKCGYRGVSQIQGKWYMAAIKVKCKNVYLGCFGTPEAAARAFDAAAIKYRGETAELNFPQK